MTASPSARNTNRSLMSDKMNEDEINDFGASQRKKMKTSSGFEELYNELKKKGILAEIRLGAKALCTDKGNALASLKILYCNANAGYGVYFSRACCQTDVSHEEYYPFGSIFLHGMELLNKFCSDPDSVSDDADLRVVLGKMLSFFVDEGSKLFILGLTKKKALIDNENRLAAALSEHLLRKLALRSNYTLDNRYSKTAEDNECRCGCHAPVIEKYGNTSIGHPSVWHGYLDILLGKSEVPVIVSGSEELETDSPGGRTPVEVKFRNESIDDFPAKHEMLAQTIVFSYLQKKKHPDAKHFLIPCVGISPTDVVFYFYDCRNDVLLQSKTMPLQLDSSLNCEAIIALWLVVNYKYLGSGLSPQLHKAPKSDFHTVAGKMIQIYRDDLSIGDINSRERPRKFEPALHRTTKFIWPPDFPTLDWGE